ncbi:MAG: enoyl-CoA hydratase/isomerase family protein [Tepidimonas sp.]|uniref:enoyl-CoA hydratase/isomerase family protein n=1 Tax=Tepidimonas sp. TaxID=2002775 RepID=UPI00298F111F|nr:enoyl-CoA hydratase/isomerase family protein [Tepidimonas sp.]MDW8336085.1 enoyl-CoA hydratase/isomerase family protein [Tepidimonas sp.]
MSDEVVFHLWPTSSGHRLAQITLNKPTHLNALSLRMVDAMQNHLNAWAQDPDIVAVLLDGAGSRAFCAGGDVVSLYRSIQSTPPGQIPDLAAQFFEREYRLDYTIHTYPKPMVCCAHGYVMGGGVGLLVGASHRIVTADVKLAMPEISIGLYPDVGGSWWLGRLPLRIGAFLAITGATLNASDALWAGLADYVLPAEARTGLIEMLQQIPWSGEPPQDKRILSRQLQQLTTSTARPPSHLQHHGERIADIIGDDLWPDRAHRLAALAADTDPWLVEAGRQFMAGSPTSAVLSLEMQQRCRRLSLADSLRLEWQASVGCCIHHDFPEGVRALLIDKDRQPRWHPTRIDEVTPQWIEAHLSTTIAQPHPLADLT